MGHSTEAHNTTWHNCPHLQVSELLITRLQLLLHLLVGCHKRLLLLTPQPRRHQWRPLRRRLLSSLLPLALPISWRHQWRPLRRRLLRSLLPRALPTSCLHSWVGPGWGLKHRATHVKP